VGGKRQLAGRLVDMIEAVPHSTYAEVFLGMGGVFLRRRLAPAAEVVNDLSGDVANLFRILQRHYVPLLDELRWRLTGREEFARLLAQEPETLTDLERAARFLYVQRLAFGGKVAGRTFGVSKGLPGRFDVQKLAPVLEAIHERLTGVIVERLPWETFLGRYDSRETLFYLDPPYDRSEGYYGAGMFSPDDHQRLAEALARISGRFILSINDTPRMRSVFGAFRVTEADLTYRVSGAPTTARELIVEGPS
jgi:DNA adenine methylase